MLHLNATVFVSNNNELLSMLLLLVENLVIQKYRVSLAHSQLAMEFWDGMPI